MGNTRNNLKMFPLKVKRVTPLTTPLREGFLKEMKGKKCCLVVISLQKDVTDVGIGELDVRLAIQGYSGLKEWAAAHNYSDFDVYNAYGRWCDRSAGFPRGNCLKLLIDLSKTVCFPVSPVLEPYYPHFKGARLEYNLNWIRGKKKKENGNLTSNKD